MSSRSSPGAASKLVVGKQQLPIIMYNPEEDL
jgi:hypothetical protein